jgi:alkylation response protein AidB-like acyl-CoA dehydrogenase
MDFGISEDQQSIQKLAHDLLEEHATHARFKELEATAGSVFDRELWRRLASAGLTGLAVPEAYGGAGLGLTEVALLLEEIGAYVAPVPAVATLVLGGLTIAQHGTSEQQARLLPGVADGSLLLTAAFAEPGETVPWAPVTTAAAVDGGWRLDGAKAFVPWGDVADWILVSASTSDGVLLALVPSSAAGLTITPLVGTNREPLAALELDGVVVPEDDIVAAPDAGADVVRHASLQGTAALAMLASGVCARALRMTAKYTGERHQFGKPIAEFQAVAQRAADAFVDAEIIRLTAYQAIWRLAEGEPAADEVAVAKFWAGEGGSRIWHAAQHLHGGIGVDLDYPLFRYTLWCKQIEHTLGTPTRQLLTLGASLAATPV